MNKKIVYVGLDVHKNSITMAYFKKIHPDCILCRSGPSYTIFLYASEKMPGGILF